MRAAWLVLLGACYRASSAEPCTLSCDNAACPGELVCGIDRLCQARGMPACSSDGGAANHDEDSDGKDDVSDNFPADPNPDQADGDGDGVGDVCDPHPTLPIDRIRYFDSFQTLSSVWIMGGGDWVAGADEVVQNIPTGTATLVLDLGGDLVDPTIETYVTVTGGAAAEHDGGAQLITGGIAPDFQGRICYADVVAGRLWAYWFAPNSGSSRGESTPLSGSADPIRIVDQASVELPGDTTAPTGVTTCFGRRADVTVSDSKALNGAADVSSGKVALYAYYATATFTSVTVFDRKP